MAAQAPGAEGHLVGHSAAHAAVAANVTYPRNLSCRDDLDLAVHAVLVVAGQVAGELERAGLVERNVVTAVRSGPTDTSPGIDGCSASVPVA